MRWSKPTPRPLVAPASVAVASRRRSRERLVPALLALAAPILVASALLVTGSSEEKHISVYSTAANYSLPVLERNLTDYVGLLELFEPLGAVSAKVNGTHWKFRYYEVESEFTAGQTRARIHGTDVQLPASFLMENGRGLVPLSSLGTLLPRILGGPVTYNQAARRLFIGNVEIHFTAQVMKTTPPALVMNFTAPVNPSIATEPGKLRMVFSREAVVAPGSQALTFDSKIIPSATFQEDNGRAEVVVTSSVPLIASFSNDGRTITIQAPAQAAAPPPALPPAPVSSPATTTLTPPSAVFSAPRRYFAVVDPSHGGDERGAALTDQLAEKDVTLAIGRRLRQELDARGLPTLLLRDGDTALSLDQRASLTNSSHPAIYISLHAASQGTGVRVYTALVPAVAENRGPFLGWDAAQTSFQPLSRTAWTSLAMELQNRQVAVRSLIAPLRPLNNITTAAVAIEVAPPSDDVSQLNSAAYQQLIATAIAAGVADFRDKLEAGR
jgi:N-acetylmuramoyl-L-alanine amidase